MAILLGRPQFWLVLGKTTCFFSHSVSLDAVKDIWDFTRRWSYKGHIGVKPRQKVVPIQGPLTTTEQYDCSEGVSEWKDPGASGFSDIQGCSKVIWKHGKIHSKTYDIWHISNCHFFLKESTFLWIPTLSQLRFFQSCGEIAKRQEAWSVLKQQWCCERHSVGCVHTTVLPFDCFAGFRVLAAIVPCSRNWKMEVCHAHIPKSCDISSSDPLDFEELQVVAQVSCTWRGPAWRRFPWRFQWFDHDFQTKTTAEIAGPSLIFRATHISSCELMLVKHIS